MLSRSRSVSRPPGEVIPGERFKDSSQKLKALKLGRKAGKKRNKEAYTSEGHRVIHKHARSQDYNRVLLFVVINGSLIVLLVFLPVKLAMFLAPSLYPLDT